MSALQPVPPNAVIPPPKGMTVEDGKQPDLSSLSLGLGGGGSPICKME